MLLTAVATAGLTLSLSGCSVFTGGQPAQISQGTAIETGDPSYDDFFDRVVATHDQAEASRDKSRKLPEKLVRSLGLGASASALEAMKSAKERADALKEEGVLLHIRIFPEPKVVTSPAKGAKVKLDEDAELLVTALLDATTEQMGRLQELDELEAELLQLASRRQELAERTADDFGEAAPIERSEVDQELAASEQVIETARTNTALAAGSAARFVLALAKAVDTGAADAAAAPAPKAPVQPPPKKPAWQPKPSKPKPSADFDP